MMKSKILKEKIYETIIANLIFDYEFTVQNSINT